MLIVSEAWRSAYPGGAAGILVMRNVTNPNRHPALERHKEALERQLRSRFSGYSRAELKAHPPLPAYAAYYKHYKKTYHVQLQLESVALKDKSISRVAALVDAMFVAELKNLLLTAGHDLGATQLPVTLDVSNGSETYVMLNGKEQVLKPGDMMISDAQGVISSVVYGPDRRTRITPETQEVFFSVYAPPGIGEDAVRRHLHDIQANVTLFAPQARIESLEVYSAETVHR